MIGRRRFLSLLGVGAAAGGAQIVGAASAQAISQLRKSGDYRLVSSDAGKAIDFIGSSTARLFVPVDATAPPIGAVVEAAQLGSAQVMVVADSGVNLFTAGSVRARARYSVLSLRHTEANKWLIVGDSA